MSILVNTGFKVGSAEPLNEYSIRETVDDRDALVTNRYVYEGMEVYCKDTKIKYRWNGAAWDVLDNTSVEDDSSDNTSVFDKSIDTGKYFLLAKITDANYTNNILKFSCPNFKGQNQVGFTYADDMDILKFELHFNTGTMRELNGYGVTLKQHGLGLYSYPLNDPKNTAPEIKDAVRLYWDSNKSEIYVFLVDLMTAIPHCCLEYTGSGTLLKENTFISDNMYNWNAGSSATWQESKWKSIPYNKLEAPPIFELGGNGGSADCIKTYTTLGELGLTAPVSVGEIFNAMPIKTMAMINCEGKEGNTEGSDVHITDVPISFGVLTIKKNELGRFSIEYQNSLQDSVCNVRKWIGTLKGLDGTGLVWKQLSTHSTYTDLSELGLNSTATLKDITKTMANNSMIAIKVDAMADQSEYNDIVQGTVTIYKVEDARIQAIMTDKATGRTWIGIIGGANTIIGWKRVVTETEITNELTNTSTINQIPNASIVGGEIHGKFIDMAVYSDALKMPIGKWRVDSNAKASQMQNLPVSKAGILEVNYLQGSDGQTAYTGTFKYAMLTYTAIDGNIYKRSFNSDNTVGNIVNDTGWEKIQTGINYSTTEQAVGTWIDGSTVYRKVFIIDSVSAQTTEADVEICNLGLTTQKRIISFSGAVNSIGSEGVLPYAYFPNSFQFFSYIQNDRVYFKGTWKYPLNTVRIIVEYIK